MDSETIVVDDAPRARALLPITLVGVTLSFGMVIGSLAPWVHASRITVSGWLGFGVPIVIASFGALGLYVLHVIYPRRLILVFALLIGIAGVAAAAVVCLLVWGLSGATGLLVALLARGTHRSEFAHAGAISIGWGIVLLGICSFGLCLLSFAALFDNFGGGAATGFSRPVYTKLPRRNAVKRVFVAPDDDGFARPDSYVLDEPQGSSRLDRYR